MLQVTKFVDYNRFLVNKYSPRVLYVVINLRRKKIFIFFEFYRYIFIVNAKMKKFKFFQKLKFNSSISSTASSTSTNSSSNSSSSSGSSCIQKDDIEERQRMLTYEQEKRVPKIQMRVKRSDTTRLSQSRFSAIGSINSSSQNMIYNNKRYSAADLNAKEITYIYKVLIIGNSSVGKTSLMNRFCNNTFMPNYIDTIGVDFKTKIIKVAPDFVNDIRQQQKSKAAMKRNSSIIQTNNSFDDQALRVKLQIWDTTGAQRFQSIALNYYRGANGILLVYDVSDRKSFENVKKWMKQISDYCTDKAEVCLVANKCDKIDNNQRKVTKLEGETLAAMYGIKYIETSAKSNINIERTFTELTKNIRKKLDLVIQLQSKTEEMSKDINPSFKSRTHRKFSKIFNANSFISCFVCNSRQLSENT